MEIDVRAVKRSNKRRARRARATLNNYAELIRGSSEPLETLATDLIADLMHLYAADPADVSEYDDPTDDATEWMREVVRRASDHFTHEQKYGDM